MEDKPAAALVLSLISGTLTFVGGLSVVAIVLTDRPGSFIFYPILEVVSGLFVIFGAVKLFLRPNRNVAWGTVVLIFSALGLFSGRLEFLLGFSAGEVGAVLGIVGGTLAIAWKPSRTEVRPWTGVSGDATSLAPIPAPSLRGSTASCPQCHEPYTPGNRFCPSCGTRL